MDADQSMTQDRGENNLLEENKRGRLLTADLPGIGGVIKERPEDFVVEELPLYSPCGEGEHTFFEIQKVGLSTFEAVRFIARALGVPPNRIGYAGLKDARAVTRQVLSVQRVPPESVMALDLADAHAELHVLWAERHRAKLKIGHLLGNRFTIRIRGVDQPALPLCQEILDVLARRGVPNYYGTQRFGQRGDSARLGRAVVQKDARGFIRAFLGGPHASEHRTMQEVRARFDKDQWEAALRLLPGDRTNERRALHALIRTQGDYGRAYSAVPKRLRVFLLSAYQSALFNRVLDARLDTVDRVFLGDLAVKHPGRSVFRVEDEAVEQPRAGCFEISPSGPIFGYKMMEASGQQGDLEAAVLASEELTFEDFRVGGGVSAKGARRAMRFQVQEPQLWYDAGVMLRFALPKGCYATTLLAEITKAPSFAVGEEQSVTEITEL